MIRMVVVVVVALAVAVVSLLNMLLIVLLMLMLMLMMLMLLIWLKEMEKLWIKTERLKGGHDGVMMLLMLLRNDDESELWTERAEGRMTKNPREDCEKSSHISSTANE